MIRATDIHSLSDFQRNAKSYIQQITLTKNPIAITVNGAAEVVVQDAAAYQSMVDRLEKAELVTSLKEAMRDIDEGHDVSLDEFKSEMNGRYVIRREPPHSRPPVRVAAHSGSARPGD